MVAAISDILPMHSRKCVYCQYVAPEVVHDEEVIAQSDA